MVTFLTDEELRDLSWDKTSEQLYELSRMVNLTPDQKKWIEEKAFDEACTECAIAMGR